MPFRNVAIVAHVDHGKTTLVDAMLRQSGALAERGGLQERVMDTGDLEREKGITILAKNTAVHRHNSDGSVTVINVIDTPGHADFGGEVERGLSMVDGVLLLVDASEGPLPQTRFVLRKALAAHLPVILVVNKTDRPDARIAEVVEASHDLLLDVASDLDDEAAAAAEHALGLPTLFASGRAGVASTTQPLDGQIPDGDNLDPLFEVLDEHVPPPKGDPEAPLQALVTNLDASTFLGRLALIRVYNGRIRKGQQVAWLREEGAATAKITELLATEGVQRTPTEEAVAGDIVAVAGLPEIMIGDTLADLANPVALPRITVDEPAISVTIGTNTSPLAGKVAGHKLTARMVRNRLDAELVGNVSIRVLDIGAPDAWEVQGRGELALAVLVEQMRREGFELTVGKPQVVTKTIDGRLHEPFEAMTVDCPEEYVGAITQLMAARKGRMVEMANHTTGWVRMDFVVPSRGLIGWRTDFLTETRGTGVAHAVFDGYKPWAGEIRARHTGSLVSDRSGTITPFALLQLADRGQFFVEPGQDTYEGMVVGINPRPEDLDINVTREKKLTNMRSSTADVIETLAKPLELDLERAMEFCAPDECVEVTPEVVRVRKVELDATSRARSRARAKARG
ncbi:MAG: translational GTPase TypA [Mycobacterium pseudokansasii]|uniref:Large ribosomal subunit assembly factor BipA n=1 Tax=Mycobacterium pseudokansasii TaxID=2341080 RepID=A0A498QYI9_9MYCO|nr:translational GTPase TypA [Mycobacterium pseudokansasii]KZS66735.1 GTP-binding protein TypA [Mycobacterium kansasii]MBY0387544.1 translational GTPase TypA [Mycobacterium pseudokansasii]VAZ99547.1 GTP-binding protein TypA/BipA [Mycobacterium pseudokansasii]VBA30746.1 GTP-binding protein TypA/BipA [Mycobacterium pseudokansasii]VBA53737.1 GTP-binding protein TypA/BipA [Mycobacterium pseudokansasii]